MKKKIILVLVVIVMVVAAVFLAPIIMNPIAAKSSMKDYVAFRVPSATDVRIQCQNVDTDHNDYLSCEAAYEVKDQSKILMAECPIMFSMNNKCRQVRNVIQTQ